MFMDTCNIAIIEMLPLTLFHTLHYMLILVFYLLFKYKKRVDRNDLLELF